MAAASPMSTKTAAKPLPYGRNADGTRNAEQQAVIKEIMRRTRHGHSAKAIADDLNRRKITTQRPGGRWYPTTIRAVLVAHVPRRRPRAEQQ
jgi:hypothetical protein